MKKILLLIISVFAICISCEKDTPVSIDNSFEFVLQDTAGVTINRDAIIKLSVKKTVETKKGYTVDFKTDKGTLTAQTINFEGEYANTYLRLDENESIYYLTAKIKDENGKLLTEKSLIYTPSIFKDDFVFSIADTLGIRADGHSEIKMNLIGKKEKYDNTIITFVANRGNILLNDIGFSGNSATSYFRVSRIPGNTYISANVKKDNKVIASKTIVLNLNPALPSSIALSSNKSTYNLTEPLTLQTALFDHSQSTNISEGLRVVYNAYQLSSSNAKIIIGNFADALDIRTNSEGKVNSLNFVPDSRVDTTRNIIIESTTQGITGVISKIIEFKYHK